MSRPVILVLAGLLITGCSRFGATVGDDRPSDLSVDRFQQIEAMKTWDIRARAAITRKGEGYNLGIRWRNQETRQQLVLEAPFGQGVFRIQSHKGNYSGYRLTLPDGQVFDGDTAEDLLIQVLGWSIPVSGLEYWVRGLPRPGASLVRRLDRNGRPYQYQQDGWTIDYQDFFPPTPEGRELPRKIKLTSERLTLKLIIEHWQKTKIKPAPSELFPDFSQERSD